MTELNLTVSLVHSESIVKIVQMLTAMGMSCVTSKTDDDETNIKITIPSVLSPDTILTLGTLIGQVQVQTISSKLLESLKRALQR